MNAPGFQDRLERIRMVTSYGASQTNQPLNGEIYQTGLSPCWLGLEYSTMRTGQREQKVCLLCGPNADHWWSRCVKVWASTDAGQKYLGAAKASQRVQEAMKAKAPSTATSTIEDVTLCVGCTLEATRDSSMEASSLVNWVCEGMGLSQEDDGSMFYEAIDYITQEQDMLQSELQK